MTKHQSRVQEVYHFFENNDTVLGFRKLLDCAMDTQDMDIYKESTELTDWKEKNPGDTKNLIERAKILLQKINEIEVHEVSNEFPVLSATDIKKSYGSQKFALGPVSLHIKKGQVYGLVGENGNGKTTLLRILANELKYSHGTLKYTFNTVPKDDYDLCTKLVYIPQRTDKWYVLADDEKDAAIPFKSYALERIKKIEELGKFRPQKIDFETPYKNAIGMFTNGEPEKIIVEYDLRDGNYLKANPIHQSQKIVSENKENIQFEFFVKPNEDFLMELLKRSWSLKVIEPISLKEKMREFWRLALERNV